MNPFSKALQIKPMSQSTQMANTSIRTSPGKPQQTMAPLPSKAAPQSTQSRQLEQAINRTNKMKGVTYGAPSRK